MKFTTQQENLIKALQNLVRNTDTKYPMFANIEIKCINDTLQLTASNGAVTLTQNINADVEEETPIAIPAQKFYDIISKLNGLISFDNGLIKNGKHKLNIPITNTLELPVMDFNCEMVQIDTNELKQALKGRIYACDKLGQGILSGICLNKKDVVSTNGNLMAIATLNNELPFEQVIISEKLANEIIKTFDCEQIEIGFDKNKIILKSEDITIISNLLFGNYPKYQQIIPTPKYQVELNRQEILKTLEITKLIIKENQGCFFSFDNDVLTISTDNGSTQIDIKYNDAPMKIFLNVNYISDCLKNMASDVINFGFTAPLSACLINAGQEISLVMPMQVKG